MEDEGTKVAFIGPGMENIFSLKTEKLQMAEVARRGHGLACTPLEESHASKMQREPARPRLFANGDNVMSSVESVREGMGHSLQAREA